MNWTMPYPWRSRSDNVRRINMSSEPGNESFFCALRPIPRILSLRRRDYASQVQIGEPSRRKMVRGAHARRMRIAMARVAAVDNGLRLILTSVKRSIEWSAIRRYSTRTRSRQPTDLTSMEVFVDGSRAIPDLCTIGEGLRGALVLSYTRAAFSAASTRGFLKGTR